MSIEYVVVEYPDGAQYAVPTDRTHLHPDAKVIGPEGSTGVWGAAAEEPAAAETAPPPEAAVATGEPVPAAESAPAEPAPPPPAGAAEPAPPVVEAPVTVVAPAG